MKQFIMLETKRVIHAAIALSVVASVPTPSFAAKSAEGMQVKTMSASQYYGKPMKSKTRKIVKKQKAQPKSMTLTSAKVDATTPKEMRAGKVVVNAAPATPIEKMKPITANETPVVSKAKAQAIASATVATTKTSGKLQRPAKGRPTADTVSATSQPARMVVVNEELSDELEAETDLTETLDRLPIERQAKTTQPTQTVATRIAAPALASDAPMFRPVVQFRNRLTLGRKWELEEIGGKNYSRKHEVYLGAKHSSGFGATLTGSVSGTSFADNTKDAQTTGDITTILYHPTFYKDTSWDFYGLGRIYFPTSDASKTINKMRYYYYFGTNYTFTGNFRLENGIGLHYFTQNKFADDDIFFLFEEELYAKYDVTKWLTLGFGPYLQVHSKERTAPGTAIELTPFLGFNLGEHAYFEAKSYLPIFTDGSVGSPRNASLNEIGSEIYLKLWL